MAAFSLKSGADKLDFDIQGNVTKGGVSLGKWTVTEDNNVRVTKTAGGTTDIDVEWGFNAGNHLELRQAGDVAFDFHNDASVRPEINTDQGVLLIAPDQNNIDFVIELRGDWSMDDNFDLLFKIGDVQSKIDGLLSDTELSEFSYIFITQGPAARHYELDFTGAWQQSGAGLDVEFAYDREDGDHGVIKLPPGLNMDPFKNVLVYTYNKGTHTGSLELAGTLRVNSNFSITYVLDSQETAGIKTTTFAIATEIKEDSVGEARLKLNVQQNDQEQVLEIGGDYHGVVAGLDLTVGFSYKRTVAGRSVTDTVAFIGQVVNPDNSNAFTWQFKLNGKDFDIDITAHIALSSGICINAALNVQVHGQQMAIVAMFGISTNCRPSIGNLPTLGRRKLAERLSG